MSQSRSQSPVNDEIFRFSPLKNKLKQPKPHQRLCRVKFLKSPKTASPSVSQFKASAFPTIYHRSKLSCKVQTRSPPSKRSIKSPVPQSRSTFQSNYMKSHSILIQKEKNSKKFSKKIKNDTFISHLLQLSHLKTSRIKLQLDKQSKIDN